MANVSEAFVITGLNIFPIKSCKVCKRCKITGVNQDTGVEDKLGPLEVLRQYRAPEGPAHAKFGQYMIPLQRGGTIRLGDTVKVLDRKK